MVEKLVVREDVVVSSGSETRAFKAGDGVGDAPATIVEVLRLAGFLVEPPRDSSRKAEK